MPNGIVLVLSAPSGAGKSTLCRALAERCPEVRLSISCTTRKPRPGEVDGRDYFFLSEADFIAQRDRGELLEWAQVHGHWYGTPRAPIDVLTAQGLTAVLNIDTVGAQSVRRTFPSSVLVFITPPSWKVLESRLRQRNQDDDDTIRRRLDNARAEVAHIKEYDYVVVNNVVDNAVDDLRAILRAEQRRRSRIPIAGDGLPDI